MRVIMGFAAAYGLVLVAAGAFTVHVPWSYFQILDRGALETDPLHALFFLHAQPPLLNGILALALAVGDRFGCGPETILTLLMRSLDVVSIGLFAGLARRLTGDRRAVIGALVLVFLVPGQFAFAGQFFYTHLLQVEMLLLLVAAGRALESPDDRGMVPVALALGLIANTRSMYHPLWAGLSFGLVSRLRSAPWTRRGTGRAALGLAILVLAWPLKNRWVFGQATASSWHGHNLSLDTPCRSLSLEAYRNEGVLSTESKGLLASIERRFGGRGLQVLTAVEKSGGGRNWNSPVFLTEGPALARCAWRWRIAHPQSWAKFAIHHYTCWTRAPSTHPWTGEVSGPDSRLHRTLAALQRGTIYRDLLPILASPLTALARLMGVKASPLVTRPPAFRITVFGAFLFPALLLGTVWAGWRMPPGPTRSMMGFMVFQVLWVLVVPCLTDGEEGNRMRHGIGSILVLLGLAVHATLSARRSA